MPAHRRPKKMPPCARRALRWRKHWPWRASRARRGDGVAETRHTLLEGLRQPPRDILTGFLSPDERTSYGRPVGVEIGPDKQSLLIANDVGDVIWRVRGRAA